MGTVRVLLKPIALLAETLAPSGAWATTLLALVLIHPPLHTVYFFRPWSFP